MVTRYLTVGVFLLSFVYIWATFSLPSVQYGDPLGPKAFPFLVGVLLIITSGKMFLSTFGKNDRSASADVISRPVAVSLTVAGLFCYFLLLEPLGFIVATFMFILAMTSFFNRGRWLSNVTVALVFPIVTKIIFTRFLGIGLPSGVMKLIGLS